MDELSGTPQRRWAITLTAENEKQLGRTQWNATMLSGVEGTRFGCVVSGAASKARNFEIGIPVRQIGRSEVTDGRIFPPNGSNIRFCDWK